MLSNTIAMGLPTFSPVIFAHAFVPVLVITIFTSGRPVGSKSLEAVLTASPSILALSRPKVLIAYSGTKLATFLSFERSGIPYRNANCAGNDDLTAGVSR